MRFLPHEHADVTAALDRHGIDPASVLFVKRRGRLHVQLPGRKDAFAFFREKRTSLTPDGRWQEQVAYFIGMDRSHACGWPEVLRALEQWLGT